MDGVTTSRTQPPETPRPCRYCGAAIILARPSDRPEAWFPYDAMDIDPVSAMTVAGFVVIVSGRAWRHRDLLEHYAVELENGEPAAREIVAGFPHHRPHHCPRD